MQELREIRMANLILSVCIPHQVYLTACLHLGLLLQIPDGSHSGDEPKQTFRENQPQTKETGVNSSPQIL